jgi:energy-coupling factor transporter ATP-binding protein EcfA2
MAGVAEQVDAVLAARREQLPRVREEIARWRRVDSAVVALDHALAELCGYPGTPRAVAGHLAAVPVSEVRPSITRVVERLQRVESRMARRTVCIGVAGASGAGKSTLLQSISGLADAWLPTGGTGPVTAVPVRLSHTPGRYRAVLDLHTSESLRATHHDARELQGSLWSYDGLLDRPGGTLELAGDELDRLREYVAYPTGDAARPARRYLAVRQARIECGYPNSDAAAISVVDLPGLDKVPDPLAGLRHELDLVLLVKRAVGRTARWTRADEAALALLDDARGSVRRRGDFVTLVLNTDRATPRVRWAGAGVPVPALQVDARKPADVSERVLRPVLSHLADRLSTMDSEVLTGTRALTGPLREELVRLAVEAKAVLRQVPALGAGDAADAYRRADELHARLATALDTLLVELRERGDRPDPDLVAAVDHVHAQLVEWVRDGLGMGYERWRAEAVRTSRRDGGTGALAVAELGRARREIRHRYAAHLDPLLRQRTEQVWSEVAGAVSDTTGALLRDETGYRAMVVLAELAAGAAQPCAVLASAVAQLLAVRLDYHTHLHPRIGLYLGSLPVPAGQRSADRLYRMLCTVATRAAERVRACLRDEAAYPGRVLYAAVERFADAVLHSSTAEQELRQLARSYRDELCGGTPKGLTDADVRVVRAVRAADELLAAAADGDEQVS